MSAGNTLFDFVSGVSLRCFSADGSRERPAQPNPVTDQGNGPHDYHAAEEYAHGMGNGSHRRTETGQRGDVTG